MADARWWLKVMMWCSVLVLASTLWLQWRIAWASAALEACVEDHVRDLERDYGIVLDATDTRRAVTGRGTFEKAYMAVHVTTLAALCGAAVGAVGLVAGRSRPPVRHNNATPNSSISSIFLLVSIASALSYAPGCGRVRTDQSLTLPDGRTMAYLTVHPEAQGPTVLFVHGSPADASSWTPLIKRSDLELDGLSIVAVDRLGFGGSSAGAETSLATHAESLEPFITQGTILVGHSYGGPVALRAAAEYADRVGGVVLIAGACDANMQDAVGLRRFINGLGPVMPNRLGTSNRELLALTEENQEMGPLLSGVRCPVVICHGTWDPVCPHDGTVAYLQEMLSSASVRVVSIPRGGHNLHRSHTKLVAQQIRQLAEEVEGPETGAPPRLPVEAGVSGG